MKLDALNEDDTTDEKKEHSVSLLCFEVLLTAGFIIGFLGGIVVGLNAI